MPRETSDIAEMSAWPYQIAFTPSFITIRARRTPATVYRILHSVDMYLWTYHIAGWEQ